MSICEDVNSPASLAVTTRTVPVAVFFMLILAWATLAPAASTTVPWMSPVISAKVAIANKKAIATVTSSLAVDFHIDYFPFLCEFLEERTNTQRFQLLRAAHRAL